MRYFVPLTGVSGHDRFFAALKRFARTSLEHSFLPGSSVWHSPDQFAAMVEDCAGSPAGEAYPDVRCAAYLAASPKAAAQWDLESRFHVFEAKWARRPSDR
jgi:adenosine deaminase